ncbi:MAG: glycoside hydrolase family 38 N-terminal domain-containing protein [Armatimonadota bacterium]
MSKTRTPVYIVQHNHFDPTWRRCWDRIFDYKGERYRSYADLEERFIKAWIENARSGATFSEGQAVVIRKYLERHPEQHDETVDLVKRGLLELTTAGETVPDTNMVSGETLLRNFVLGQQYFEETFGVIPSIAWLEDAFGQSAQIPQMLRGIGCDSVQALYYKRVPGGYWKGLDGSVLFTGMAPNQPAIGNNIKLNPCSKCSGMGCVVCHGTGLGDQSAMSDQQIREVLMSPDLAEHPFSLIVIGGEETIPCLNLPQLVTEAAAARDDVEFIYGGYDCITRHMAAEFAKIDDDDIEVSDQMEANPVSTGCYVSRIKLKQRVRKVENLLNATERWATVASLLGAEYPTELLLTSWRNMVFLAFHDAITSDHLDSSFEELMDMLDIAETGATTIQSQALTHIEGLMAASADQKRLVLYNSESWPRTDLVTLTIPNTQGLPALIQPDGQPVEILDASAKGRNVTVSFHAPKVPAVGYCSLGLVEDTAPIHNGELTYGPGSIENEFYRIEVGSLGITSLIDKRSGKEQLDISRFLLNELILEEDIGHPWGTMQPPSFEECLSKYTTRVQIRRTPGMSEIAITGQYKGDDAGTYRLSWRQVTRIYKGSERIDFHTDVNWDSSQRRLRIAFPTMLHAAEAVYSIPYGAITRASYEPEMNVMHSTNGDWPTVNWLDIFDAPTNRGVALINTGTPSHKVIDGVIYLSILRSPIDSWCLNEPEFYDCPDYDGARDAGQHEFTYSLIPHTGDYRTAGIEKRAREMNTPITAHIVDGKGTGSLPARNSFLDFQASDNVIITAIKKADQGDAIIVRLAETAGEHGIAVVWVDDVSSQVSLVNFLEHGDQPVCGLIDVGPFKVLTVKLT